MLALQFSGALSKWVDGCVIDYRDFFAADDGEADAVIQWLNDHPHPIVRHRCAYSWNWDNGHRVLGWIASQPTCDRATAIHIFWAAHPHEVLDPTSEFTASYLEDRSSVYHLLELIADLIGDGRFTEENLETQWSEDWEHGTKRYASMLSSSKLHAKWERALAFLPKRPIFEWNPHPAFPEGIPSEIYFANVDTGSSPRVAH